MKPAETAAGVPRRKRRKEAGRAGTSCRPSCSTGRARAGRARMQGTTTTLQESAAAGRAGRTALRSPGEAAAARRLRKRRWRGVDSRSLRKDTTRRSRAREAEEAHPPGCTSNCLSPDQRSAPLSASCRNAASGAAADGVPAGAAGRAGSTTRPCPDIPSSSPPSSTR